MMLIPRKRNEFDLFEDMFNDPFWGDRKGPAHNAMSRLMSTDIKEKDGNYIIEMDLPGYEKENISIELENGYLNVSAKADKSNEEKNEKENFIHRERFYGECSRSFYVGDNVTEEDIKAAFKNGTLTLTVPKEEPKKLEEKKTIQID